MANQQYCWLLNPSLLMQSDFTAKSTTIWLSLYKFEKVLMKSNYLIEKVGTPYTQCVYRIRPQPNIPKCEDEYISVTTDEFRRDPSLGKFRSEYELFDSALEQSLEATTFYQTPFQFSQKEHDKVQQNIPGAIAGSAVAVPAAIAPVVWTQDAQTQVDAPEMIYGAGEGPPIATATRTWAVNSGRTGRPKFSWS